MKFLYCKKCGTRNESGNQICSYCKTCLDKNTTFEECSNKQVKDIINPKNKFFAIIALIIPILEFISVLLRRFNPLYTIIFCFIALDFVKVSFKENKRIGVLSIVLNILMIIISFILLVGE